VGVFVSDKLIIFTAHIDRSDMTPESTAVTIDWPAWLEATWSFGGAATIRRAAGGSSTRRDHVTVFTGSCRIRRHGPNRVQG